MTYTLVGLALLAVIAVLAARRSPAKIVIANPTLGVLNLGGSSRGVDVEDDLRVLAPRFSEVRRSDEAPPRCDVLLVYCDIDSTGALAGSGRRLREIIRDSWATVVVVATEHPGQNYIAAAPRAAFGQANLVMTLGRKGPVFAAFLARLFDLMKQGVPMPVAWNKLAPQAPRVEQDDVPSTIFACERGQVVFG
jgi:hypothetical protein